MCNRNTQPAADGDAGFFDAHQVLHYATNGRRPACGLLTDYAIHTDEPETVAGCQECLAAAAVPAGCPDGCDAPLLACCCYVAGYNAGLAPVAGQRPAPGEALMRNKQIIGNNGGGYTIVEYDAIGPNPPERRYVCDSCDRHYIYPTGAAKHVAQKHGAALGLRRG